MKQFSPVPYLQIIYSDRKDGSLRGYEAVKNFLEKQNIQSPISISKLEHLEHIIHVNTTDKKVEVGDALLTNLLNHILTMVLADCFPVILFDQKTKVLALLHCGWKSLMKNLIALTLEEMHNAYQTDPKNVFVWIGPGICSQHYTQLEKPEQLALDSWHDSVSLNENKIYSINLNKFIHNELQKAGVIRENIQNENVCTYENGNLFSHRLATQKGDEDGRFLVAVWQE